MKFTSPEAVSPALNSYSQYLLNYLRIGCDKAQFIVRQWFLGVQVRVLGEFQYPSCLIIVFEMYPQVVIDMPETFDAAVFTGSDDSSCLK